ncbi:cysteine-rich receptor-like protein kinase 26 isoform X4 [Juglans regia]|uniref:non-specific serine/threonine protein kinase n=1 Tax=Juglans regia TaxID=51240 RepID=A0A6P9E7D0_JUGRE|nr:cysteine-rich receptor-like protein kinase 26 isoform X4 [Juglans regia]
MAISSRWLFFLSAIVILTTQAVAQRNPLFHFCLNNKGNYTSNSTYDKNLNHLLSSLSSDARANSGFFNSSYGNNSDEVHAIGLCRGDSNSEDCRSCLNNATSVLKQLCPVQKEAILLYDHCMFRYSNRSIFGLMETVPSLYMWNVNNVPANSLNQFNDVLWTLLEGLRDEAAAGGSLRKYAVNNTIAPQFMTLYALVQCTPDLSREECDTCLTGAFGEIRKCCSGKQGARVFRPSCNFRFEIEQFYYSTSMAPPIPSPQAPPAFLPPPSSNNTNSTPSAGNRNFIVVLASITFMGLISSIAGIYIKAKWGRKKAGKEIIGSILFDFDNIKVATNNFSEANKLRETEFGTVYKGTFSNKVIAVKRLSTGFGQEGVEFEDKVLSLTKLQHPNIVELLGCSVEGNERLVIYDFVPNTSLDHYLSDPLKVATLDWEMRYKIIRGIAQGVLYLHEESKLCFNHGLKASNIFVDEEMNPKISDFGLKSLLSLDQIPENTSRIGRIEEAPDVMHMLFSTKTDVFNFGVLVLEIVSGQKNNFFRDEENADNLLSYAWRNFSEGTASNIIDPTILMPDGSTSEIINCILTALLCAEANEADRPTMASVVTMLDGSDKHGSMVTEMPSFEDDHRVLGRRTFLRRVRSLLWTKKGCFRILESS